MNFRVNNWEVIMDAKDLLIESYISWMKQNDYADSTIKFHRQTLNIYFDYLANNRLSIGVCP